jgi:unconventional prefoldin RPB5 interactor 1
LPNLIHPAALQLLATLAIHPTCYIHTTNGKQKPIMELTEIERQRRALEENVQKLRQSLKHWQTWEAEYEGLKEELIATGPEALTAEAVSDICKTYGGALVTEKEILELAGQADSGSPPRRRGQILGQISRRQEYVQRNIDTISKQFFVAEGKLEEFAFASVTASGVYGDGIGEDDDEGGLPLSEIHEELDDDENFVRGEVRRPEETTGKVLERLRMAGLSEKDLGAATAKADSGEPAAPTSPQRSSAIKMPLSHAASASKDTPAIDSEDPERPPIRKKSVSFSADTKEGKAISRSNSEEGKKSVSFADKVAVARAAPPADTRSVSFSRDVEEIPAPIAAGDSLRDPNVTQVPVNIDPDSQKDLRAYFKPGDKVFEVNDETETTQPHIMMPEGESEEDAAMRREMLNYHLNEVNNVVATMELDDPDDDDDDDEHDDSHSEYTTSEYQDEDTPYTSGLSDSDVEDEDEFGRSKRPAVTDAYRDEMEALKARLIGNLGKIALPDEVEGDDADAEVDPADARRLVIREKRGSIMSDTSDGDKKLSATSKKRVSFAEALDVAKPSSPPHKASKHVEGETVAPIVGGVAERSTAVSHSLPAATPAASFSRFKQARAKAVPADEEEDAQSGAPTGPPGIPMADTLLERTPASVKAPDADGYDPLLARRELASEYYRRRNDMVREQGGFKIQKEEDEDMGDLMEERDDGQVKKVSRFKAARLGK